MYLDIIETISNAIDNFKNNPFESLFPFIVGAVFGFVVCLLIYALIIVSSFKKTKKNASNNVLNVEDEVISGIITNQKNKYIEESSFASTSQKVECLKENCIDLVNEIASSYYPNSKYPIYELSIDELILLTRYISDRIDGLFSGRILRKLKDLKVSSVMKMIDIKKKFDENKVVKAANKIEAGKKVKNISAVLNILNPAYWVKRIAIDGTYNAILNKIALTIIDVVGEETAKVYSKNVFYKKNNDEEIIKEIEGITNGE